MDKSAAKNEILNTCAKRIEAVKTLISQFIVDEATYVVCTGDPAVYFKEGAGFGCGVEGATRYPLERAEFWTSVVKNGHGESARVVLLYDALIDTLVQLRDCYLQVSEA